RIGGDEFVILAHGDPKEARETVLARLQSSINLMNRDVLAPNQLSLSVGVAEFDPLNPVSLTELLSIADREMMINKLSRTFLESPGRASANSGANGKGNGHS